MRDLWLGLPVLAQDLAILAALLAPAFLVGAAVRRGFRPAPLTQALLRRYLWPNLLFVALIAVSVGLGIGILAQERGLRQGTARAADKFDLIVTAPGSEITALLATVFLQQTALPLLDGATYAEVAGADRVAFAAPLAFGDSLDGRPVIGTTAQFVAHLSGGVLHGRNFARADEAVIGAGVPLEIGATFSPHHGDGAAEEEEEGEIHEETRITVTGRMAATGTPWDRAVLVPVETVWAAHGLPNGHAAPDAPIGPPFHAPLFPGTPAILVGADALFANYALRSEFDAQPQMMAFFPATVLTRLYQVMGDVRGAMSLMAGVAQGLVGASIVAALWILTRLFARQMALLRALGAPSRFVFAVVWSYAATLICAGILLGGLTGVAAAELLSQVVAARTDIALRASLSWREAHLLAGTLSAATLLALIPAWAILRTPVVASLRA